MEAPMAAIRAIPKGLICLARKNKVADAGVVVNPNEKRNPSINALRYPKPPKDSTTVLTNPVFTR